MVREWGAGGGEGQIYYTDIRGHRPGHRGLLSDGSRAHFARGPCSRVPLLSHDLIIEVLVLDLGDIVHGVLDIDDLKDVNKVLTDVSEVHNVYRGPR